MMNAGQFHDALTYWLPLLTICTIVYRAWNKATARVGAYADKLLKNHLSHIQENTAASAALLTEMRDGSKQTLELTRTVHESLNLHMADDLKIQGEILKDLAILKDR